MDALKETSLCPGCKEPYKVGEYEEDDNYNNGQLQLPGPGAKKEMSMTTRNQGGDFDTNRWLFESQGTYGYGNAYWPPQDQDGGEGPHGSMLDSNDKPWKPLCRVTPIPAGIISPYRYVEIRDETKKKMKQVDSNC